MVLVKKRKEILYPLCFLAFLITLITFSKDCFLIAKESLNTWFTIVIPSLFIFLVINNILSKTGLIKAIGILLEPIMKPLFNVPGIGAFPLIVGLTSGYPAGAKIIRDLYENKQCTKIEAERLLTFTNNCSPIFITGAVAIGIFNNESLGLKLLLTHHISAIIVGILFRFFKKTKATTTTQKNILKNAKQELYNSSIENLPSTLTESIKNSAITLVTIGGYILLFSVLLNILINLKIITLITQVLKLIFIYIEFPLKLASPIISGIIELTTGITTMSKIAIPLQFSIPATSFILGFGGISVIFQVAGVLVGTPISIKPYIFAKILQAFISTIICNIFI